MFSLGLLCALQACNSGPDYKTVRDQVISQHDELMGDDEKAMMNKMKLDTLGMPATLQKLKQQQPQLDTAAEKRVITALTKQLTAADDAMGDWMHNFNPDVQQKNNQQAVDYFKAEKVKVQKLDSAYKVAIKASDEELDKFHIKADAAKSNQPMKMKM